MEEKNVTMEENGETMEENNETMGELMEEVDKTMMRIHTGDILEGKVISVEDDSVVVNTL